MDRHDVALLCERFGLAAKRPAHLADFGVDFGVRVARGDDLHGQIGRVIDECVVDNPALANERCVRCANGIGPATQDVAGIRDKDLPADIDGFWRRWDEIKAKLENNAVVQDVLHNGPKRPFWLPMSQRWFDVLNRIMVIRSTVKPHEKSPEEPSQDGGSTDKVQRVVLSTDPAPTPPPPSAAPPANAQPVG